MRILDWKIPSLGAVGLNPVGAKILRTSNASQIKPVAQLRRLHTVASPVTWESRGGTLVSSSARNEAFEGWASTTRPGTRPLLPPFVPSPYSLPNGPSRERGIGDSSNLVVQFRESDGNARPACAHACVPAFVFTLGVCIWYLKRVTRLISYSSK